MENYSKRPRYNTFVRAMGRNVGPYNWGGRNWAGLRYRSGRPSLMGRRYPGRYSGAGFTRRVGMYGRFGTGRQQNAQIERKFYDTTLVLGASTGVASTTQATGAINLTLPQNTSANGRIGQKIIVKSIQVKFRATLAAGATDNDHLHIWLIQDTQANGALPAIGDVFDAGGGIIGTQLRNIANGNRFKILNHTEFDLNADAGVAAAFGGDVQQKDYFIKCNIPLTYNSTAGAIGEIRSNNLFMVYGSPNGVATTDGVARIRYTDR